MDGVTIVGLMAGAFTTFAFLPQVIQTWRRRSAAGLSLLTFLVFCTGISLWLAYGLMVGDLPLIIANGVSLVLAGTLLVLKLRYP